MLYRNDSFRPRVTGCTFKRVWESCLSMIFLYASFVYKPFTCSGKGFFICVAKILFLTYIFKINRMAGGTVEGGNMKKRVVALLMAALMGIFCMTGCGNSKETTVGSSEEAGSEAGEGKT